MATRLLIRASSRYQIPGNCPSENKFEVRDIKRHESLEKHYSDIAQIILARCLFVLHYVDCVGPWKEVYYDK